jgi:hypothetical protein
MFSRTTAVGRISKGDVSDAHVKEAAGDAFLPKHARCLPWPYAPFLRAHPGYLF